MVATYRKVPAETKRNTPTAMSTAGLDSSLAALKLKYVIRAVIGEESVKANK